MNKRELLKWAAPVLSTTVLPAHAQVSSCQAGATISAQVVSITPPPGPVSIGDTIDVEISWTSTGVAPEEIMNVNFIIDDNDAAFKIDGTGISTENSAGSITLQGTVVADTGTQNTLSGGLATVACSGDIVDFENFTSEWTLV